MTRDSSINFVGKPFLASCRRGYYEVRLLNTQGEAENYQRRCLPFMVLIFVKKMPLLFD